MDGRLIIENKRFKTREKINSLNPATLESVGEASLATSMECQQALQAAKKAFSDWKELPFKQKGKIFLRAKHILLRRSSEIARLITKEKGTPFSESLSTEVENVLEVLDYYTYNLRKALKPKQIKHNVVFFTNKRSFFHFQPLGVTLIISPWNFPLLIPFYDILGALSAGNTVIFRPSTSTPFCGLVIGEILIEAGLPPGVFNIVPCRVPQAEDLILNPEIQTILFTGSVPTGKRVMELASRNLTKVVLELGGKDAMVVLKDADLERATRGAIWAAFMNSGQSCGSVERVYVEREIAEEFIEKVVNLTKELNIGNPIESGVDIGPMANLSQLQVVEDHIKDALEKGARLLCGGKRLKQMPGYFFPPTVLSEVNHGMKIMKEETFGPVLPVMTFSEPKEAVSLANDSSYGLTASVWTRSKKMANWMVKQLAAGTVTVNDHMFSFVEPGAIWGGIKQTGRGRTHGPYGIQELLNIKFVSLDFSKRRSQIWWYPYKQDFRNLMEKSLIFLHHQRLSQKIKAIFSLLPHWTMLKSGTSILNFIKGLPKILRK